MALIEVRKEPSPRELFWFGLLFVIFFVLFGVLARLRFGSAPVAWALWGTAGVFGGTFWLLPGSRKTIYRGWMYAVLPIAWTASHVILAVVYYLVVTPIGLMARLCGRDALQRRWDLGAKSYWIANNPCKETERYFRQF